MRRRSGKTELRPKVTKVHTLAQTITALVTALTAIGALVFTGLSLNAVRVQNEITAQGQFTDRFTKAVDQLGRTGIGSLQARLGGIYALERLAFDSARDQPTIVEVMSAFVRTTSPKAQEIVEGRGRVDCPYEIGADVHAALVVLGRRNTTHDKNIRVNLSNTCFGHVDLRGASLQNANLSGVDLSGADLREADLSGADMTGGVDLRGTDLRGANLRNADLYLANAANDRDWEGGADLSGANLSHANLRGADLDATLMIDVDFSFSDLVDASLYGNDLSGGNMRGVNLCGTNLTHANLGGVDLRGSQNDSRTVIEAVATNSKTQGQWW
jgi:uncharacterized protein YjbI with pentapeptide repeats